RDASTALQAAVVQFDASLFALTQRADRAAVQKVLRQLGRLSALCARSPTVREELGPPPRLSVEWVRQADDDSSEYRIALAIASLSLQGQRDGKRVYLGILPHLIPVTLDGSEWDENSYLACWGAGSLERNLAEVLHRRRLEATRLNAESELLRARAGARLEDVQRFLAGETDDQRIMDLLWGLACTELDELVPVQTPERA